MPLKRLKNSYRVMTWRGVEFWMADETGSLVFCRVNREALRGQAKRAHFDGTDDKVLEVYQDLLEQVASDAFDANACNEAGCVIVTKEALDRMSRAPRAQNCITRPRLSLSSKRQPRQLRPPASGKCPGGHALGTLIVLAAAFGEGVLSLKSNPLEAYVAVGGTIKRCWFNATDPLLPNHVYRADVSPGGSKVKITVHRRAKLGRAGLTPTSSTSSSRAPRR